MLGGSQGLTSVAIVPGSGRQNGHGVKFLHIEALPRDNPNDKPSRIGTALQDLAGTSQGSGLVEKYLATLSSTGHLKVCSLVKGFLTAKNVVKCKAESIGR